MITPHPPKRKRKSKNLFSSCQLFQVIGSINVISVILKIVRHDFSKKKIVRRDRQKKEARLIGTGFWSTMWNLSTVYSIISINLPIISFFYAFLVVTKKRIQTNKTSINLIKA